MLTINYYSANGQYLGYDEGGAYKDFLTDAIGSVTGEVDQTGTNRTFNGRYKPFGGSLWSTGTRGRLGWNTYGNLSSTFLNYSEYYQTGLRYFSTKSGSGTSYGESFYYELGADYDGPYDVQISYVSFTANGCPRAKFRTTWRVPNFKYKEGGIIQHVKVQVSVLNCKTGKPSSGSRDFIEVWPVDKKGVPSFGDADTFGVESYGNCTSGASNQKGKSGHYYFSHKLLKDWTPPGGTDNLPHIDPTPGWIKDGNTIKEMRTWWNCCIETPGLSASATAGPIERISKKILVPGRGKEICHPQC